MAKIRKRAKRDVKAAYQPQFDAIHRAKQQAVQEAHQQSRGLKSIYRGLNHQLRPLTANYNSAARGIQSGLQDQLAGLAGMLNMGGNVNGIAPGEESAAKMAFGQLGAGGFATLAGDQQRQQAWGNSTLRQSAMERASGQRNLLEDKRQLLDDIRNQRIDLTGEMGPQILTRIDELRDSRAQRRLAQQELELRQKLANKDNSQEDRAYNDTERKAKEAKQYTLSQVERKHDRAAIKPVRRDISDLHDRIKALEKYQESVGRPNAELQAKIHRAERKIKKKRKRIRKIKRTDSYA